MRTSGGAAMNSTMSDCTTSTMSIGTPSAACIEKPPALNAPNRMPATKMPHGVERPSSATVIASKPMPASMPGGEAGGDGAEHLADAGEAERAHRR